MRVVEQATQDLVRTVEREIGDDAERLGRQLDRSRIRLPHLDVRPTPGEPLSEARIELDRDHPTGRSR